MIKKEPRVDWYYSESIVYRHTRLDVRADACKHMQSKMELAPYPLALLELIREQAPADSLPLGMATRVGLEKSAFNVPAHRFLEALINHAPSPDTIAGEFLVELGKCGLSVVETLGSMFRSPTRADLADPCFKAEEVYNCTCTDAPCDWAVTVHQQLQEPGANITGLTQLATHYFSHLVIACTQFFLPVN